MKRTIDVLASILLLVVLSPFLLLISLLVWAYDFGSPFYLAKRVGMNGRIFRMLKFRSMVVDADRSGVMSTAGDDRRITPIGRFIRRFKLDELMQLCNVLRGDMSLVGPRPNVPSGTAVYTPAEMELLTVRPGVTDFASIVFSDEGEILEGHSDPDKAYDTLIRPWKSRLGLFYIGNASLSLDMKLLFMTVLAIFSRPLALARVATTLSELGAQDELVSVSRRTMPLSPTTAPGM